jgi:Flp pilus assembly pilin Flp
MMRKLWNDECGAIISAELVLVMTIVGIGMITGLTSLRDGVIEELADVGAAIGSVDQSYTVGGATAHSSGTSMSVFSDAPDFCDNAGGTTNSRCLLITGSATNGLPAGNGEAGS